MFRTVLGVVISVTLLFGQANASHSNWPEKPDLEPLVRVPAKMPDSCKDEMRNEERVLVEFDVNPDGIPQNPSILRSSNSCFDSAALWAVTRWKFMKEHSPASHVRYEFSFLKSEAERLFSEPKQLTILLSFADDSRADGTIGQLTSACEAAIANEFNGRCRYQGYRGAYIPWCSPLDPSDNLWSTACKVSVRYQCTNDRVYFGGCELLSR